MVSALNVLVVEDGILISFILKDTSYMPNIFFSIGGLNSEICDVVLKTCAGLGIIGTFTRTIHDFELPWVFVCLPVILLLSIPVLKVGFIILATCIYLHNTPIEIRYVLFELKSHFLFLNNKREHIIKIQSTHNTNRFINIFVHKLQSHNITLITTQVPEAIKHDKKHQPYRS